MYGSGVRAPKGSSIRTIGGRSSQGTEDADALLLTAGHFGGILVRILLIGHVDHFQQFMDDLVAFLLGVLEQPGYNTDILGHSHIGEEADLLDYIADAAAQGRLVDGVDVLVVDVDMPAVGIDQTVDHLESGGFAAAAGADKNDKFTFFDLKIEVIEDYIVAILFGYMFKPNH